MELVLDANILFSALIKDSLTAELLFNENLHLYSPEFIIHEFLKYSDLISSKKVRTNEDFIQIMHLLKDIITVIPKEEYLSLFDKAALISPDEKDVLYFALAMKLDCAIWSNDKRLHQQDKVKIYTTTELKHLLLG